jgi:DNA-binding NarL/FixJ family response regulator
MNILIADDHALLRKGLVQILIEEFPAAHFGEASNAGETMTCLSKRKWSVLVLDVFMPGRSGLEVLTEVRQQYPKLPILVLSSAPEEQLAVRVLRSGANGYLNKQTAPEDLVKAVNKVMSGGRYVSAAMAERLAAEIGQASPARHEKLSDREYAVLRRLAAGDSIKKIAGDLSLSAKTVSTYHTRIWEKLGIGNDVELVRYAIEHGLA